MPSNDEPEVNQEGRTPGAEVSLWAHQRGIRIDPGKSRVERLQPWPSSVPGVLHTLARPMRTGNESVPLPFSGQQKAPGWAGADVARQL